jgi:CMP-2-keto-3-deoxyoctulosonic acid synthetase
MRQRVWGHEHWKHIGVYGFKPAALERACSLEPNKNLEQLAWLEDGMTIHANKLPFEAWRHLDDPEDVAIIEALL